MYVCMYIRICVYVCIYIYTHTQTHTHTHTHTPHMYVCIYKYICIYICLPAQGRQVPRVPGPRHLLYMPLSPYRSARASSPLTYASHSFSRTCSRKTSSSSARASSPRLAPPFPISFRCVCVCVCVCVRERESARERARAREREGVVCIWTYMTRFPMSLRRA